MNRTSLLLVLALVCLPLASNGQAWTTQAGGTTTCPSLRAQGPHCYYAFTDTTDPLILPISSSCRAAMQLTSDSAAVQLYACTEGGTFTTAKCGALIKATDADGTVQDTLDGATSGKVKFDNLTGPFIGVDVTSAPTTSATLVAGCHP